MKIVRKISQSRRDFRAVYGCGHCGNEVTSYGYDDANFHNNVIPSMVCPICKKNEPEVSSAPSVPAWKVL